MIFNVFFFSYFNLRDFITLIIDKTNIKNTYNLDQKILFNIKRPPLILQFVFFYVLYSAQCLNILHQTLDRLVKNKKFM